MIYKYTGKLLADCSGKKSCCNGRVNTTWQGKKNFSIPDLLADFSDSVLNKGIHFPVSGTSAYTKYEVGKHLLSFYCMKHFRMELDRIQLLLLILCSCYRTVCCMSSNLKSWCNLRNIICVAHPADCFVRYVFEDFGICLIYQNLCLSIFAHICFLNFSAQNMHHKLCAIAKSQNRNTKLK